MLIAFLISAIVHRDLKLENILLADNPDDPKDKLYIKVLLPSVICQKDCVHHMHRE